MRLTKITSNAFRIIIVNQLLKNECTPNDVITPQSNTAHTIRTRLTTQLNSTQLSSTQLNSTQLSST